MVRVLRVALSNLEILQQNTYDIYLPVEENCVFQFDCSTPKYQDISKNRLPIWTEGSGASCGIMTACSYFDGSGQYRMDLLQCELKESTLLIKLWPNESNHHQILYTAMDSSDINYTLELIPHLDQTFQICFKSGSVQLLSTRNLIPQLWQDIAVVFSTDKVTLYIDGVIQGNTTMSYKCLRSLALIGAEYQNSSSSFKKGFNGYLAYVAEFSQVLEVSKIIDYCTYPPYEFEKSLVSFLKLDCPEPIDLISKTPLLSIGTAKYCFTHDTTDFDTPIEKPYESRHFIWTRYLSENQSGHDIGALGTEMLRHIISTKSFINFLNNLDKIYDTLFELIGTRPFNRAKVRLVPTTFSGSYIVSNQPYIFVNLKALVDTLILFEQTDGKDVGFLLMHELAHLFNTVNECVFDSEFFANAILYYALEKMGMKINIAGFEGGKERMIALYNRELLVFNSMEEKYPIFGASTAEPAILSFYPVLESLGGWDEGWAIMKKVFHAYNDPSYIKYGSIPSEFGRAFDFYNTVREVSKKDITTKFPSNLKAQIEKRYFSMSGTQIVIPHIQYDSPKEVVTQPDSSLIFTFTKLAQPVEGKKITLELYSKRFPYEKNQAEPFELEPLCESFSYTLTKDDIPENTDGKIQLKISLEVFGIKSIIESGAAYLKADVGAWNIEIESGAFVYENKDFSLYRKWIEAFYSKSYFPPLIMALTPNDGAVNISENGTISIRFSRPMDKFKGTITLDNGIGVLNGEWSADSLTYSAYFKELTKGILYSACISGFQDIDGIKVLDVTRTFTRDTQIPNFVCKIDINNIQQAGINWYFDGVALHLKSNANIIISGKICNRRNIIIDPYSYNVNLTLNNVSITFDSGKYHCIQMSDARAKVILFEGSKNILMYQKGEGAGIRVDNAFLTMDGKGTLDVHGGGWNPAIGGINGNIIINDGTITAKGGEHAAGIGGVSKSVYDSVVYADGDGGQITINGGDIKAYGGAGIDYLGQVLELVVEWLEMAVKSQ